MTVGHVQPGETKVGVRINQGSTVGLRLLVADVIGVPRHLVRIDQGSTVGLRPRLVAGVRPFGTVHRPN